MNQTYFYVSSIFVKLEGGGLALINESDVPYCLRDGKEIIVTGISFGNTNPALARQKTPAAFCLEEIRDEKCWVSADGCYYRMQGTAKLSL